MRARIASLGKLDRLYSKKKCFQLKNGRFLTCFRGGAILSLTILLRSPRVISWHSLLHWLTLERAISKIHLSRQPAETPETCIDVARDLKRISSKVLLMGWLMKAFEKMVSWPHGSWMRIKASESRIKSWIMIHRQHKSESFKKEFLLSLKPQSEWTKLTPKILLKSFR